MSIHPSGAFQKFSQLFPTQFLFLLVPYLHPRNVLKTNKIMYMKVVITKMYFANTSSYSVKERGEVDLPLSPTPDTFF